MDGLWRWVEVMSCGEPAGGCGLRGMWESHLLLIETRYPGTVGTRLHTLLACTGHKKDNTHPLAPPHPAPTVQTHRSIDPS